MDRVAQSQYFRQHLSGLTPQQRHQQLVHQALQQQPGRAQAAAALHATETDYDALRKHHRFLRDPDDDAQQGANSWGARLARRYYARLFKEYAIADLSRYKESKIGLRWRTQAEVVAGKGQFTCGAKGCDSAAELCAYEVNFAYEEAGQHKQALVKLSLCEDCACRLNYRRDKSKQYKKLGGLSAFDQQQEQQRELRRQQEHEGRRSGRSRRGCGSEDEQQPQRGKERWESPGQATTGFGRGGPPELKQQDMPVDSSYRRSHCIADGVVQLDRNRGAGAGLDGRGSEGRESKGRDRSRSQGRRKVQEAELEQRGLLRDGGWPEPGGHWQQQQQLGGGSKRGLKSTVDSDFMQRGRAASEGADGHGGKRARSGSMSQAAAVAAGSGDGAAGGGQDGEGQGEDAGAADEAAAVGGGAGGGARVSDAGVSDRWELQDGDLNDTDIERWLDSLFTTVQAGRKK